MRQPGKFKYIPYCKKSDRKPIILSIGEVQRLFDACTNLKHKTIMYVLYATGVRMEEVLSIEGQDKKMPFVVTQDIKIGTDAIRYSRGVLVAKNITKSDLIPKGMYFRILGKASTNVTWVRDGDEVKVREKYLSLVPKGHSEFRSIFLIECPTCNKYH